jgi:hypothetical protein
MSTAPSPAGEESGRAVPRLTLGDVARARLQEVYRTYGLGVGDDEAAYVSNAADLVVRDAMEECRSQGLGDDRWLVHLARLGATVLLLAELGPWQSR